MQIGLDDIDPKIAAQVAERLTAPAKEFLREEIHWGGWLAYKLNWQATQGKLAVTKKRDPSPDERAAFELRQKREEQLALRIIGASLLPFGAAFSALAASKGLDMGGSASLLSFLSAGAVGTGVAGWWANKATPKNRLRRSALLPEWKAVLPLLRLSRAERIYCDVVLLLARTQSDPETEANLRGTLKQLNELLEAHRQLDAKRQALLGVMGAHNVAELEAEYGELGRRLDTTTDPVTRQSLEQSLQMCAAQLENAKNLGIGMERLNSQQEAIQRALSAALSTMARMQVAAPDQSGVAAEQIAESVAQMRQQAYAVEQAVEEVMQIRIG